jgi:Uma2 family endonuclease
MNLIPPPMSPDGIVYPESDGKPMADNTRQARWIVVLYGNLCALFRHSEEVFIAADLRWYPIQRHPEINAAPDVMVVFGRPKGDRGSYKQWEEADVPVTVAFEILSPGNSVVEMDEKFLFYEDHGVEEYYLYDPEKNHLMAYVRHGQVLRRVRPVQGHISPRLGIRLDLSGREMVVYYPDGRPFLTFEQLEEARLQAEQRADAAEQRAEHEQRRAEQAEQQNARLRELSRKVLHGQATPEERQELERLTEESASAGPSPSPTP